MITNILWLLNYVRENILEKFVLPELGISYWDWLIILSVVAVIITVLVNGVQVSGSAAINDSERRKYEAKREALENKRIARRSAEMKQRIALRQERDTRFNVSSSINSDWYDRYINSK